MSRVAAITEARAFAPASCGNVAVGFDLLGFAFSAVGDRVHIQKTESPIVEIEKIQGIEGLSLDPRKNTAGLGLVQLIQDLNLNFGFKVSIEKGIALGSGMGGSAASAVASIVAANALLSNSLTQSQLLYYALIGEGVASGSFHADNVAPSLLGGLVLADSDMAAQTVSAVAIPIPDDIHAIVVHPHFVLETKKARGVLKESVTLKDHIRQSSLLAHFISACYQNNIYLLEKSLADVLIEPQRAHLIPGFYSVKEAALRAGALGCSIAGAGPSVFAWAHGSSKAHEIKLKMEEAFLKENMKCEAWVSPISKKGPFLLMREEMSYEIFVRSN